MGFRVDRILATTEIFVRFGNQSRAQCARCTRFLPSAGGRCRRCGATYLRMDEERYALQETA